MDELTEQILAEKENVDIALHNLKTAMARTEKTVIELAAIATFLQWDGKYSKTNPDIKRYHGSKI
jgi:hypothetical protein